MDAGELIVVVFWGLVILFSILQAAAQKQQRENERRRKVEGEGFDFPEIDDPEAWAADKSAETMVPADVWEEIAGLARGEGRGVEVARAPEGHVEPAPERIPQEAPVSYDDAVERSAPTTREELERRARMLEGGAAGGRGLARRRRRPLSRPAPATRGAGVGTGQAASDLLGELSGQDLRKAFILHEVLAPPVSNRRRGRGGR